MLNFIISIMDVWVRVPLPAQMKVSKYKLYLFLVLYIAQTHAQTTIKHKTIDEGLDHYSISSTYDSYTFTIHIFKINSEFYDFRLLNKS